MGARCSRYFWAAGLKTSQNDAVGWTFYPAARQIVGRGVAILVTGMCEPLFGNNGGVTGI
jgi:hypothetical protein